MNRHEIARLEAPVRSSEDAGRASEADEGWMRRRHRRIADEDVSTGREMVGRLPQRRDPAV